jgi:hypothetical protein
MIYPYQEAKYGRFIAAVMFKSDKQQKLIEDWCLETFGEENRGFELDNQKIILSESGTWDMGHGDFIFLNQNDLFMFVLRWKGEV